MMSGVGKNLLTKKISVAHSYNDPFTQIPKIASAMLFSSSFICHFMEHSHLSDITALLYSISILLAIYFNKRALFVLAGSGSPLTPKLIILN